MTRRKPDEGEFSLDLGTTNTLSRRRFIQASALAMVSLPSPQSSAPVEGIRRIALVVETSGINPSDGHRIIEIALVGVENDQIFNQHFHAYLDPDCEVCPGAEEVHGLGRGQLAGLQRFPDIARDIYDRISGAHLIVIRSSFTLGFLDAELRRAGLPISATTCASITEVWSLAKRLWPSERNDIDSVAARLDVPLSNRDALGKGLQLARTFVAMAKYQTRNKLHDYIPSNTREPCVNAVLIPGKLISTETYAALCDFNGAVAWRVESSHSNIGDTDICFEAIGARSLRLSVPEGSAARNRHHVDFNLPSHGLATYLSELVHAVLAPSLADGLIGVDIEDVWAVLRTGHRGQLFHFARPMLHEAERIPQQINGRVGGILSTTYLPSGGATMETLRQASPIVDKLGDAATLKLAGAPFVLENVPKFSFVILTHGSH